MGIVEMIIPAGMACQVGWLDGLQNLRRLSIGDHFNQSLEGVKWPPNLEQLSFGYRFNKPLEVTPSAGSEERDHRMFYCRATMMFSWFWAQIRTASGCSWGCLRIRLPDYPHPQTDCISLFCPKRSRMVRMGLSENRLQYPATSKSSGGALPDFSPNFSVSEVTRGNHSIARVIAWPGAVSQQPAKLNLGKRLRPVLGWSEMATAAELDIGRMLQ